jgi:hypothetical protein
VGRVTYASFSSLRRARRQAWQRSGSASESLTADQHFDPFTISKELEMSKAASGLLKGDGVAAPI